MNKEMIDNFNKKIEEFESEFDELGQKFLCDIINKIPIVDENDHGIGTSLVIGCIAKMAGFIFSGIQNDLGVPSTALMNGFFDHIRSIVIEEKENETSH